MKLSTTILIPAVVIAIAAIAYVLTCVDPGDLARTMPTGQSGDTNRVEFRSAIKYELGRDVIDGRRSLLEAAAIYGWLNELDPRTDVKQGSAWLAGLPSGQTYTREELLCCQVVGYAEGVALVERPRRKDEISRSLRQELRALLKAGVKLPEVDLTDTAELMERAGVAAQRFRSGVAGEPSADPPEKFPTKPDQSGRRTSTR